MSSEYLHTHDAQCARRFFHPFALLIQIFPQNCFLHGQELCLRLIIRSMMKTTVLSLGGSIIAPDKVDDAFLSSFRKAVGSYLDEDRNRRLVLVCGGGAPARIYQNALRSVCPDSSAESQDWLGIRATHLNGALVRAVFEDWCKDELVTDPTKEDLAFTGQVLVAAGWKPGFSTDTDAVHLAHRFGADTVVNLSNIAKVYTDDPKKNPEAKPIDRIGWADFQKIVGTTWEPGKNTPFDPIASTLASQWSMTVVCADGKNIGNTMAILTGMPYVGTTISDRL